MATPSNKRRGSKRTSSRQGRTTSVPLALAAVQCRLRKGSALRFPPAEAICRFSSSSSLTPQQPHEPPQFAKSAEVRAALDLQVPAAAPLDEVNPLAKCRMVPVAAIVSNPAGGGHGFRSQRGGVVLGEVVADLESPQPLCRRL